MQLSSVESLGFSDGSIVKFEVDQVPATHQEWAEAVGELALSDLFGEDANMQPQLTPHPEGTSYTMERKSDGSETRDWWAGDHIWHIDGTRWNIQPVLTLIGCVDAAEGSPGTELLDTVALLEIADNEDFFEKNGVVGDDVLDLVSVFADSTYYREALPHIRSTSSPDDQLAIDKRVGSAEDLANIARLTDEAHPAKDFKLVQFTWLDGYAALFLDGGGRNSRLVDAQGNDFTEILRKFRLQYLTGDTPYDLGIVERVEWSPNQCLAFPQVGTLHRAEPGNQFDRKLHLAFLVDEKEACKVTGNQVA